MLDRTTLCTVISDSFSSDIPSLNCARGRHSVFHKCAVGALGGKENLAWPQKVHERHLEFGIVVASVRVRHGLLLCDPASSRGRIHPGDPGSRGKTYRGEAVARRDDSGPARNPARRGERKEGNRQTGVTGNRSYSPFKPRYRFRARPCGRLYLSL